MPEAFHIDADGSQATTIHFVYQDVVGLADAKVSSLGGSRQQEWRVACAQNAIVDQPRQPNEAPWLRSDDARAVTCPLCRDSKAFQKALADLVALFEERPEKRRQR